MGVGRSRRLSTTLDQRAVTSGCAGQGLCGEREGGQPPSFVHPAWRRLDDERARRRRCRRQQAQRVPHAPSLTHFTHTHTTSSTSRAHTTRHLLLCAKLSSLARATAEQEVRFFTHLAPRRSFSRPRPLSSTHRRGARSMARSAWTSRRCRSSRARGRPALRRSGGTIPERRGLWLGALVFPRPQLTQHPLPHRKPRPTRSSPSPHLRSRAGSAPSGLSSLSPQQEREEATMVRDFASRPSRPVEHRCDSPPLPSRGYLMRPRRWQHPLLALLPLSPSSHLLNPPTPTPRHRLTRAALAPEKNPTTNKTVPRPPVPATDPVGLAALHRRSRRQAERLRPALRRPLRPAHGRRRRRGAEAPACRGRLRAQRAAAARDGPVTQAREAARGAARAADAL